MNPKLIALAPLLVLLVACGGGPGGGTSAASSGSAASGGSALGSVPSTEQQKAAPGVAVPGADASTATQRTTLQRAVISKGSLEMQSRHVANAREQVINLVRGWGGTVADEQSVTSTRGVMTSSDLTLKVPSDRFDTAMARLPDVARTLHTDRSAEDVTTQVIDTGVRVRAQERSIRRIEQLLGHARTLGQIISIESDLADRQAALDSLKSQQAYLHDQTSLSTIQVTITRPDGVPPVARHHHAQGLLAGLSTGAHALGRVTLGALTVVGVAAPFVAVLALVGVPVLVLWRRRRPAALPVTPAAPPAAPAES